uniref:Galectin n=1 Tax=Panagrolaimus sp. ES5 TaxID=591445 RepID=A0AC34FAN2_9BILA
MTMPSFNSLSKQRICNPILPYITSIPGGIFVGKTITIRGIIFDKEPYQFCIDLCCGRSVQGENLDNKALHFNPRFIKKKGFFGKAENVLVLNSMIDNEWGRETRFGNYFQLNSPFTIQILVLEHYFSISLNEKHLLNYVHRLPYIEIDALFINGAAKIDVIELDISM